MREAWGSGEEKVRSLEWGEWEGHTTVLCSKAATSHIKPPTLRLITMKYNRKLSSLVTLTYLKHSIVHMSACVHAKSLQSCPTLCSPMDAHQAPLSLGFSRQEYWIGSPCPPLGVYVYMIFINESRKGGKKLCYENNFIERH